MVEDIPNSLNEEILRLGYEAPPEINYPGRRLDDMLNNLSDNSSVEDFIVLPRRIAQQDPDVFRGSYVIYVKYAPD